MTKKHNYMTKEHVHDQGVENTVLYLNYVSMAMSGTGIWRFLSSPNDFLCSPH